MIVGGQEAIPFSYPWSIALYRMNNGEAYFQCGGTIINRRYILTAAHCVRRSMQLLNADDFQVKVGAHHLSNTGQMEPLDEIIVHENYSPQHHNDDIALLRLKVALDFNDSHVSAICLPSNNDSIGMVGQLTTMVGWGVHDQGDYQASSTLYEVTIPITDPVQCETSYSELMGPNNRIKWDNVICASAEQRDTCQGDSGGSMAAMDDDQIYSQIGIVSFGYGCAQPSFPGVYTYVPKYIPWIGGHMKFD